MHTAAVSNPSKAIPSQIHDCLLLTSWHPFLNISGNGFPRVILRNSCRWSYLHRDNDSIFSLLSRPKLPNKFCGSGNIAVFTNAPRKIIEWQKRDGIDGLSCNSWGLTLIPLHTPLLIYTEEPLIYYSRNEALNALIFCIKSFRSNICASVHKVV